MAGYLPIKIMETDQEPHQQKHNPHRHSWAELILPTKTHTISQATSRHANKCYSNICNLPHIQTMGRYSRSSTNQLQIDPNINRPITQPWTYCHQPDQKRLCNGLWWQIIFILNTWVYMLSGLSQTFPTFSFYTIANQIPLKTSKYSSHPKTQLKPYRTSLIQGFYTTQF